MQAERAGQSGGYTDELGQKRGAASQITSLGAEQQEARQGIQAKCSDDHRDQIRKYLGIQFLEKAKKFQIPHAQQSNDDGEADDVAGKQGGVCPEGLSNPDRHRASFKRC